ncbi:HD domain-containing protein [Streptomyces sp. NPDC002078]
MSTATIAGIEIPDSALVREATALVSTAADPVVFHHSRRVFLWGSIRGRNRGMSYDPELLYVGALFHDLGLTADYARTDQRFELDGADAARRFLLEHRVPDRKARLVWEAIALHTKPEIPWRMAPEIALVTAGVEIDVLGIGYEEIDEDERAAVVTAHPRPGFKKDILQAFTRGIAPRPATTFGNVKADVLERYVPGYVRPNFVDTILNSPWPE